MGYITATVIIILSALTLLLLLFEWLKRHWQSISNLWAIGVGTGILWFWISRSKSYAPFTGADVVSSLNSFSGWAVCALWLLLLVTLINLRLKRKHLTASARFICIVISSCIFAYIVTAISSNAVASDLATKAVSAGDIQSGEKFLTYLTRQVKDSGSPINEFERNQVAELTGSFAQRIRLLPTDASNTTKLNSTISDAKRIVLKTSSFVLATKDPRTCESTEKAIGSVARRLVRLGEQCSIDSADPSEIIDEVGFRTSFRTTLDICTTQYLERTEHYFQDELILGSKQAIKNYPTMRKVYSMAHGKGLELDLAVIDLCRAALQNRRQVAQVALYLRGITEIIQASDLVPENQSRAIDAVKRLAAMAYVDRPTDQDREVAFYAKAILYQWKLWARQNRLSILDRAIGKTFLLGLPLRNVSVGSPAPLRMSLEVYVDEIKDRMNALTFHRGSLKEFGGPINQNVVIEYHRQARKIQYLKWKRLTNVPNDSMVLQLQKELGLYFARADQVFTAIAHGNRAEAEQLQTAADQSLSMSWASLKQLQRKIGG